MLLQRVPERENRCLIRDLIADHVDPCKSAHCLHLDQPILHRWIAEVVLLLQQVDPQHGREWIGLATTFGAGLGIVGVDQINQRFPRATFSISHTNGSRLVRFLAMVCS